MAMNFADALDTRVSDVDKPPVLPQGTYIWRVSKVPVISTSKSGEWDIVEFPLRPVSAESDVDPKELAEFGDPSSEFSRISFMFPTAADKINDRKRTRFSLTRFLTEILRVENEDNGTLKELLANAVGCQFLGVATWNQVNDNVYVEVKHWAPLD